LIRRHSRRGAEAAKADAAAGRLVYRWSGHAGHWGHWIVGQLAERFGVGVSDGFGVCFVSARGDSFDMGYNAVVAAEVNRRHGAGAFEAVFAESRQQSAEALRAARQAWFGGRGRVTEVAMSVEEENKAVVRRYAEAFNRGDLAALRALLADDAEVQGVRGAGTWDRVEPVWRQLIEGYGIQLRVEELVAEGGRVAARFTETGTFKAPAFGRQPTGRSYELVALELFEIEGGRIRRRWGARDAASQARQLGIPPS
jgi:steroid delta-isomerase-like uncharacterized protein